MPPPSIGSKYRSEFIEGVANIDEKFIMILDMDAVFSTKDVIHLKNKAEETEKTTTIEEVGQ
jgi:purine-binding chemotaxis protein CheW